MRHYYLLIGTKSSLNLKNTIDKYPEIDATKYRELTEAEYNALMEEINNPTAESAE